MTDLEAKIHVGVTRRFRNSDGLATDVTVNLSGIPATAGDQLVAMMLGRAEFALNLVLDECDRRARGDVRPAGDPSAFAPHVEPERPTVVEAIEATLAEPKRAPEPEPDYDAYDPQSKPPAARPRTEPAIPEDARPAGSDIFGLSIPFPPREWFDEPASRTAPDGTKGGQIVALNAGLTAIGFGGKLRHAAAQALLGDYGPIWGEPLRDEVESLNDLSKAEAHVLLEWLSNAGPTDVVALAREVANV